MTEPKLVKKPLDDMSKDDLIRVIAFMRKKIRYWNDIFGDSDADNVRFICEECKNYCEKEKIDTVTLPNFGSYMGNQMVSNLYELAKDHVPGKFIQRMDRISATNFATALTILGWDGDEFLILKEEENKAKKSSGSYSVSTGMFVLHINE